MANLRGVSPDKIIYWIKTGELPALNLARERGGKPRYRITPEQLREFEQRRLVTVETPAKPRQQRKRHPRDERTIQFFK